MKNRILWIVIWTILILGTIATLTELGVLPKTGKTRTSSEVHYGTGAGDGREGVIRSEETR